MKFEDSLLSLTHYVTAYINILNMNKFRLSGFHPFAAPDDSDEEVKDSTIYEKCNPNLIQVQATNESLRFVTWALKKNPT